MRCLPSTGDKARKGGGFGAGLVMDQVTADINYSSYVRT